MEAEEVLSRLQRSLRAPQLLNSTEKPARCEKTLYQDKLHRVITRSCRIWFRQKVRKFKDRFGWEDSLRIPPPPPPPPPPPSPFPVFRQLIR
jgi:hypothetical protein